MALNRCWHKKVIRRRPVRDKYKQKIAFCISHYPRKGLFYLWCRTRAFLPYSFAIAWIWILFLLCLISEFFRLLPLWIYELFRFCPFKNKTVRNESFLIVGHRGAAAYEIENTIPSYEKAILKYHANAIEMDLCMTKDRQIVVWHDWDPDSVVALVRQAGWEPNVKYRPYVPMSGKWRVPVHELNLTDLRQHYGFSLRKGTPVKLDAHIPSFQEFLDWAKTIEGINTVFLDLKLPEEFLHLAGDFISKLHQMLEENQPAFHYILLSPEENIIKEMKKYWPGSMYSYDEQLPVGIVIDPNEYSCVKVAIELNNAQASVGRPTVLNLGPWTTYRRVVEYDVLQKEKYNATNPEIPIHKLISWTIDRKSEMKCLIKMGVDGMLTDKPDVLANL